MAEQRLTELINHNPRPVDDREAHQEAPPNMAGCIGFAAVFGLVCGFGLFLLLVWMGK